MGYDVHITRKENWFDDGGPEITLEKWTEYVCSDPEMRLDGFAEAFANSGSALRIEQPGIAVWLAYSGHGVQGNMAWFTWYRGSVMVKNPDQEILRKMWRIAFLFAARVQGDDGEIYDEQGDITPEKCSESDVR